MNLFWLLLLWGLCAWLRHTIRRLFLLDADFREARQIDLTALPTELAAMELRGELTLRRRHLVVVGHPLTGKSHRLAEGLRQWGDSVGAHRLGIAEIVRAEWTPPDIEGVELLIVDNFDDAMTDSGSAQKTLQFLSSLVFTSPIRIVLITNIDPTFYWKSSLRLQANAPPSEGYGWNEVLATFATVRDRNSKPEDSEYASLWRASTMSERVVLHQLAHDGWANFRNLAAAEHLHLRGLVQRCPRLTIFSPSFQTFIVQEEHPDDMKAFVAAQGTRPWYERESALFGVLVVVVGVVLWFAQQQTLAVLTGILSALTTLTRFSVDLRNFGKDPAPKHDS